MSSLITAHQISYELPDGKLLFENISLSLSSKVTALVGPNGVGKTCLAKILCEELQPSSGKIIRRAEVHYFPQRQAPTAITVDEFLSSSVEWSITRENLLKTIDNRQKLCTELSGGQWMRVRLAKALGEGFLVLDEPTNDLDRDGREALLDFLRQQALRQQASGVLLISHDREALSLCDEVLELSNRGLSKFGFDWHDYVEAKDHERHNLQHQLEVATRERDHANRHRQTQLERQEKRNRQGTEAGARGGMPKILLGARKRKAQATTAKIDVGTLEKTQAAVSEAHEALSQLKTDPIMYAHLLGQPLPEQKLVAEARDFNLKFLKTTSSSSEWLYSENLNFVWKGNIRLALKGPNGSGKSTLLKAIQKGSDDISNLSVITQGEIRSGHLRTLYIDQRCAFLKDDLSVLQNVREHAVADESEIRNNLAKFLFTKDKVFQSVQTLSGGERLRAALACGFMQEQKPELLILDEPTNNLDLANVEFLENLVREFRGALLVISHDDVFLKNCHVEEELVLVRL